jgi:hypothetical protein
VVRAVVAKEPLVIQQEALILAVVEEAMMSTLA